jgi:hypothetical protein
MDPLDLFAEIASAASFSDSIVALIIEFSDRSENFLTSNKLIYENMGFIFVLLPSEKLPASSQFCSSK